MPQTLSPTDSRILEELNDRGRTFLDLKLDRDWLSALTTDPAQQVAGMRKRGTLLSVGSGRYVALTPGELSDPSALPVGVILAAAFAGREDWYLGYLSALIEHRLVDEHSSELYVAVFGPPPRLKALAGRPVHMTRLKSSRKHFGQERVRAAARTFYFRSDLERTLLDTLDRPGLCGAPENWARAWARAFAGETLDRQRLVDYALKVGGTLAARCAFWMREVGDVRDSRLILRSIRAPLTGPRLLDSEQHFGEGEWRRDRDTGLVVNMPMRAIDGWLSYGK
jgi:predicted transcriptional regulator of viral defense system